MKPLNWTVVSVTILLISFAVLPPAYTVQPPQVAQDHLAMAASYEQKAQAQAALIAEHTQMKQDYQNRFFVNEKVTPRDKIREMGQHCDAIIQAAQQEKSQLLELAKWHRLRAAELQGF